MKYLVMECHLSYAVVLDGEGRFLKVANLSYEVGQEIENVFPYRKPSVLRPAARRLAVMLAAAACVCLAFLGSWQMLFSPVGTVQIKINPDVLLSVNRLNLVVGVKGLNEDGRALVDGVPVWGKKMDALTDELADRAVEMGYLRDGGKITLTVDSRDENWKIATEDLLVLELEVHLNHSVHVVTAQPSPGGPAQGGSPPVEAVVPVAPGGDWDDDDWDDHDDDYFDDHTDHDLDGDDDDADDDDFDGDDRDEDDAGTDDPSSQDDRDDDDDGPDTPDDDDDDDDDDPDE